MHITDRDPAAFEDYAGMIKCGTVYPLSMTQGYQGGDIYTNGRAVLFHHDCGFAFLAGETDESTLEEVFSLMQKSSRRLVLFSEQREITDFFAAKPGICTDMRYFYTYSGGRPYTLRDGYSVKRIDSSIAERLEGRITPSFSWKGDFLSKGAGFAVMHGEEAASWAFSAAVSDTETDIGVETAEKYRGQGLASVAAAAMAEYILSTGRSPVWACHCKNTASQRLAERLGFVRTAECVTIVTRD